jgi:hypothetical protein
MYKNHVFTLFLRHVPRVFIGYLIFYVEIAVDEPANSLTAYFRNSRDLSCSLECAGAITRIRDILPTTHDLFQLIPTPSDPFRPISR